MTEKSKYQLYVVSKAGTVTDEKAELEKATLKNFNSVLSGYGSLSFDFSSRSPKATWTKLVKYEIQLWEGSDLLWWGVPTSRRIKPGSLEVTVSELPWYLWKRFIHDTLTYTQIDQLTIGWNLVNYAQTQWPGGDLNIDSAAFVGSGVLRDRTYPADEHGQIGQLLTNLTQLDNGFDWSIEIFEDGRREWTPWYPQKGVDRPELVMEWGRNIEDYDIPEDAGRQANWITATGSGEGTTKPEQSFVDAAARDEYVLLQDVVTAGDVADEPSLLERATAEVAARKYPETSLRILVSDEPVPTVGVVKTGDRVPVFIDDGEAQVDGTYRIVAIAPAPNGKKQWLDLNPVAA